MIAVGARLDRRAEHPDLERELLGRDHRLVDDVELDGLVAADAGQGGRDRTRVGVEPLLGHLVARVDDVALLRRVRAEDGDLLIRRGVGAAPVGQEPVLGGIVVLVARVTPPLAAVVIVWFLSSTAMASQYVPAVSGVSSMYSVIHCIESFGVWSSKLSARSAPGAPPSSL